MTTKLDLPRLAALAAAATPGPWRPEREPAPVVNDWFDRFPQPYTPIESTGTAMALGVAVGATFDVKDAAFISAAREAVPALVAEVERLRETLDAFAVVCRMCDGRREWNGEECPGCFGWGLCPRGIVESRAALAQPGGGK